MPLDGWTERAAGVAVAALAVAAAAGPLHAAEPVGRVLADDAREMAVVDEHGRLVFMTRAGTVRVLDPADTASSGRDVAVDCETALRTPAVTAAGDDHVLLACVRAPGPSDTYPWPQLAPHVLDLTTGTLVAPQIPQTIVREDRADYTGIGANGICFWAWTAKNEPWTGRFDWRTGSVVTPGRDCTSMRRQWEAHRGPLTVPDGPGRRPIVLQPERPEDMPMPFAADDADVVTWAVRTTAPRMGLYAYLKHCGVRLGWDVSPLTRALPTQDALVLAESTRGRGPVTLRHVEYGGACERAAGGWRLSLAAGGRHVSVPPHSASGTDAPTGAVTTLLRPAGSAPRIRLGARGAASVRTTAPARLVRWRVGERRWQRAQRRDGRWSLDGVGTGARGRTLQLDVRFGAGGRAGYEVRLG